MGKIDIPLCLWPFSDSNAVPVRFSSPICLTLAQNLRSMIGIAGLSTAISLGRSGHSVVVLESTKEVCFVEEEASKSNSHLVVEAKNNRLSQ
jgi:hypothetical protein